MPCFLWAYIVLIQDAASVMQPSSRERPSDKVDVH